VTQLDHRDSVAPWRELAALIAASPGCGDRLLIAHQPSAEGMCVACGQGGTGLPVTPWPCSLYSLATEAQHLPAVGDRPPAAPAVRVTRPARGLGCR
jgi:hypothetical protein